MLKSPFSLNNSHILGCPGGCGGDAQVHIPHVSSTHAALPSDRWAARIFSSQHILSSDGAEIPAVCRQQVWGQGGLSKDVKSMVDSLMSFPYLRKQKDWNAGGCLSNMPQMEKIGTPE